LASIFNSVEILNFEERHMKKELSLWEKLSNWTSWIGIILATLGRILAALIGFYSEKPEESSELITLLLENNKEVSSKLIDFTDDIRYSISNFGDKMESLQKNIERLETETNILEEEQQDIILLASTQKMDTALQN